MRLSVIALLVCGAFTLAARPAHAQLWSEPVCMEVASIPGLFTGMDFFGAEKCESLCKYTGNLCKTFARDASGCNQTDAKGYWTLLSKLECDTMETLAERRSCHAEVNGIKGDAKDSINQDRDSAVAACQDLIDVCVMNCNGPMPVSH